MIWGNYSNKRTKMAVYRSPDYQTSLSQLAFWFKEVHYWFSRWRPSWIFNQNDFSYFWSTSHLNTSNDVLVNWSFGSGENVQNRFSTWLLGQPSWISDQNDFSYFWSTSHPPYFLSNFKPMGLFYSEDEVQNRFSRWQLWGPWTFSYFWSTMYKSPWWFLPSFKSIGLSVQEGENRFSRWSPSWISDCNNLSYSFILPVPSMLPTHVRANWPFYSEVRNRFSRWPPWPLPWISDWKDFIYLFIYLFIIFKSPLCFLPSFKPIGLSVQEKKGKTDFQDVAILYFQ